MDSSDLILHAAGFVAPAAFLALLLPLAGSIVFRATAGRTAWWGQAALVFVAGVGVLAAGLWWFGTDGRMATYGALVLVAASTQWLAVRAWR
jgi:hypothetical protein